MVFNTITMAAPKIIAQLSHWRKLQRKGAQKCYHSLSNKLVLKTEQCWWSALTEQHLQVQSVLEASGIESCLNTVPIASSLCLLSRIGGQVYSPTVGGFDHEADREYSALTLNILVSVVNIWNSKAPSWKNWTENGWILLWTSKFEQFSWVQTEDEKQTLTSFRMYRNKALQALHIFHLKSTWRVWHGVV